MTVNEGGLAKTFGRRLFEERARLGLTQAVLGQLLGVKKNTQCRYEACETLPDTGYLIAAGEAGLDVTFLLFGRRASAGKRDELSGDELRVIDSLRALQVTGKFPAGDSSLAISLISKFRILHPKDRTALLRLLSTALINRSGQ